MKAGSRNITLVVATVVVLLGAYFILSRRHSFSKGLKTVLAPRVLDSTVLVDDLRFLASDSCEGRAPGTPGHDRAAKRIMDRMRRAGLDSFDNRLSFEFNGIKRKSSPIGLNIIGWIEGTHQPEQYIVISAHYDHVGKLNGKVYYGASDNASGTACLLELASYFKKYPLPFSVVFIAFDKEETGLEGSLHFVRNLPEELPLSSIRMNLNLDMITRSDKNELFFCGFQHYPSLEYLADTLKDRTTITIRTGHDTGVGRDNWTQLSDHYAFHQLNIPFLYLGTEDHEDYHQPTDIFNKIDLVNYIETCNMIAMLVKSIRQW